MDSVLHRDPRSQHLRRRLDRPNTTKRKMKMLMFKLLFLILLSNYKCNVPDELCFHCSKSCTWTDTLRQAKVP